MPRLTILAVMILVLSTAAAIHAQDSRTIAEPAFPAVCTTYQAPLTSDATGPVFVDPSREDSESINEGATLQGKLQACHPGEAVELTLGADV